MKNENEVKIRPMKTADIPAVYALVAELADYENALEELWVNEAQYFLDYEEGLFQAIVAEKEGIIVGCAIYYVSYSTWKGKMYHLEDFIVTNSARRTGVGKLIFEAFIEESKRNNANLVRWLVLNWNEPAINFYKKYESIFDEEWTHVKILFKQKDQLQGKQSAH